MTDSKEDRPAEQRPSAPASDQPSRADRRAPRTLDEEQALGGPEPTRQPAPKPEDRVRPESLREGSREDLDGGHLATASRMGSKAACEAGAGANATQPPAPDFRENSPPERIVTPGEFVLALAVTAAVFLALRWILERLAAEIVLPQAVAAHPSLVALAIGAGVGTRLWGARRAKRINGAKHLRGELPT